MAWYTKQLKAKLKESGQNESLQKATKNAGPQQGRNNDKNFVSPVALRNKNRKKTDLPG